MASARWPARCPGSPMSPSTIPTRITGLGEFGVAFLLFMIGLELSWDRLLAHPQAGLRAGAGAGHRFGHRHRPDRLWAGRAAAVRLRFGRGAGAVVDGHRAARRSPNGGASIRRRDGPASPSCCFRIWPWRPAVHGAAAGVAARQRRRAGRPDRTGDRHRRADGAGGGRAAGSQAVVPSGGADRKQ